MSFNIKNIVLPSSINKKNITIALILIFILFGGVFYFTNSTVAMPRNSPSASHQLTIDDIAKSSPVNEIVGHSGSPIVVGHTFNKTELSKKLYSDSYLLNNVDIRSGVLDYCATNPLKTQIALTNCNTALKVDNSWYQLSSLTSDFMKYAMQSGKAFSFSIFLVFCGLFFLILLFKLLDFLTFPRRCKSEINHGFKRLTNF